MSGLISKARERKALHKSDSKRQIKRGGDTQEWKKGEKEAVDNVCWFAQRRVGRGGAYSKQT